MEMMMAKFRKKPVVIDAVNWNGHTLGLTNAPVDLSQPGDKKKAPSRRKR
jgi:hypothetical protein